MARKKEQPSIPQLAIDPTMVPFRCAGCGSVKFSAFNLDACFHYKTVNEICGPWQKIDPAYVVYNVEHQAVCTGTALHCANYLIAAGVGHRCVPLHSDITLSGSVELPALGHKAVAEEEEPEVPKMTEVGKRKKAYVIKKKED